MSQKWTHAIKPHEILDHATFSPLFEQGSRGADGHKGERGSPGEAVRSYDFIPKSYLWQHVQSPYIHICSRNYLDAQSVLL